MVSLNCNVQAVSSMSLLLLSPRSLMSVTGFVSRWKEQEEGASLWLLSIHLITKHDCFGGALVSIPLCFLTWRRCLRSIVSFETCLKEEYEEISLKFIAALLTTLPIWDINVIGDASKSCVFHHLLLDVSLSQAPFLKSLWRNVRGRFLSHWGAKPWRKTIRKKFLYGFGLYWQWRSSSQGSFCVIVWWRVCLSRTQGFGTASKNTT